MDARLPPQNLDAEQSVLGSILIDNQTFHKVIDYLTPEDFYRPANGKIFGSMCDLAARSEPIDVVTLTAKMKEQGVYEEVGGASYLAELLERVPTAVNSEYHARLVSDQATKRRLISTCTDVATRGMQAGDTTEELLDYAEKSVFALSSSKRSTNMAPIRDIVRGAFVELEKRFENQGQLTGVPSGWMELDKMTSGFQRSDLVIVACRPSMGKTSFSLGATRHAAVHAKVPVVFFSLEMSKESIVQRLLAAEAKVDSSRLRDGRLTERDWSSLTRAAGMLSEAQIYIDDTPALTVLEMRGKARRLKAELGQLGLVIVDYLQIMGTRAMESREKAISDISRSLKALAKELNVPVLALSQLNRSIEQRQDKRPMMSDLRESGAIEQDADVIIFIHREDVENLQPNSASMAEFIIGKHRNGPRGTVKVAWLGQYTSFENLAATRVVTNAVTQSFRRVSHRQGGGPLKLLQIFLIRWDRMLAFEHSRKKTLKPRAQKKKKRSKAGPKSGDALFNQVITLTGIPAHAIKRELKTILDRKNIDVNNLTIDQLRCVVASYLREIMGGILDRYGSKKPENPHS